VLMPILSRATGSWKFKEAAVKTQAAITFERLEITMRFQLLPPLFITRPDLDMTLLTLPDIS